MSGAYLRLQCEVCEEAVDRMVCEHIYEKLAAPYAELAALRERLTSAERVVDAARRFRPDDQTIQWEQREINLRDALRAYDAGGAVNKEKGEKL